MIHIENLTKSYGANQAVRGISFEVGKGQVVGFLGPNGAGKSTTMKVLTGFLLPTSGKVTVKGVEVEQDPVQARRHIGYLPENNPLYEEMMVEDYLGYVAHMRGLPKDQQRKAIKDAVDRCGLGDKRGKDIGELSKGYRQRVGLAQAILHNPDILVLDEPTTGLDPNQVVEIRNLIKELGAEKTVLMSTHILPEVQHTCSRAIIIADGTLKADGAPSTLTADGNTLSVAVRARGGDTKVDELLKSLRALPGVSDVTTAPATEKGALSFTLVSKSDSDPREALFDLVIDQKLVLLGLERRTISLEETFRKLTIS
ncbi:MAG: ATP-binding cassette domain-containing protein [Deltaproteobacteria bacterium]|nr:ATP-binding cassette domain-containing protein [Deltaproteobacteria bacterium]